MKTGGIFVYPLEVVRVRWLAASVLATAVGCDSGEALHRIGDDDAAVIAIDAVGRPSSSDAEPLRDVGEEADAGDLLDAFTAADADEPDAVAPDALVADALAPDAFAEDARAPDAFAEDALAPDAFADDASAPDALALDASPADAGAPDASLSDAGCQLIATEVPLPYVPASGRYHSEPVTAFDGTNFLVVWRDGDVNGAARLLGARVSPAGAILDATPIVLHQGSNIRDPSLAFEGTHFVLVWNEFRTVANGEPYAMRITSDGVVLDPGGNVLGAPIATGWQVQGTSVACRASGCYAIWFQTVPGIFGTRLSTAARPLDVPSRHLIVGTSTSPRYFGQLVPDDSGYVVSYLHEPRGSRGSRVENARLAPDGSVVRRGTLLSATGASSYARNSSNGSTHLIAWADRAAYLPRMDAMSLTATLLSTPTDSRQDLVIVPPVPNMVAMAPNSTFDGDGFVVAWTQALLTVMNRYEIRVARVTRRGLVLDQPGLVIATHRALLASNGFASAGAGISLLVFAENDSFRLRAFLFDSCGP